MEVNEIQKLNTSLDIAGYVAIIFIMALLYAAYCYIKNLSKYNFDDCPRCGYENKYECECNGCQNSNDQ